MTTEPTSPFGGSPVKHFTLSLILTCLMVSSLHAGQSIILVVLFSVTFKEF